MRIISIVVFLFSFYSLMARGESAACQQLFNFQTSPLVKTEFKIEYSDPKILKLFRKINLVFSEYPREYMENTSTVAKLTVPKSRWLEIFQQDYESVIEELSKIKIYKIETYEDGSQDRIYDADFLKAFGNEELKTFPNEWVPTQRSFSFEFDRRVLKVMEEYKEPAHAALVLENGTIERVPPFEIYY